MGKFKASKMIVAESWALLKRDKEIMWFPVLSSITSLIALIIMGAIYYFVVLSANLSGFQAGNHQALSTAGSYVSLIIYYFVMFFIVNFFQAGIYIIAHGRFNGNNLSFSDGINGALKNSGKIALWSLISATVGVVLRAIAERSKIIGKIVAAILGAAWNILTYFSLPSLVIGQRSVIDSFKESASVIRKTWGETIIVTFGVGFVFGLITFLGIIVGIVIIIIAPVASVMIGVLVLEIIFIVGISIISSSLGSIFKLALYEYASTGKIPQGFSAELIQNAIKTK